jgi:hypothetical protein
MFSVTSVSSYFMTGAEVSAAQEVRTNAVIHTASRTAAKRLNIIFIMMLFIFSVP